MNTGEQEYAHTFAATRESLERCVREIIVLAEDRPDADMPALGLRFRSVAAS